MSHWLIICLNTFRYTPSPQISSQNVGKKSADLIGVYLIYIKYITYHIVPTKWLMSVVFALW